MTILDKIKKDKDLQKAISKISYYEVEQFYADAKCYIKAIKERRMLCVIKSVSKSGMSRVIEFSSAEKNKSLKEYYYRQYWCLFKALGFQEIGDRDSFRIYGCGMDMIFHTNYTIIHTLKRLGFINKKQCDKLAQMTPVVL